MRELPQGEGRTVELNSPLCNRRRMCCYSSLRPVSGMWLHPLMSCGQVGPEGPTKDAISGKKGYLLRDYSHTGVNPCKFL
jgi:hypothetical protein